MKESILKILRNNRENYLSGQKISEDLNVTRTAIWKNINSLRDEGYVIESISSKGYKLISSPDILSPTEIGKNLDTKIVGKEIVHFNSIDSTNIKAKELARKGSDEGTIVVAEEQTSGRGRLGRVWISPKGKGIWMSIILRPDIDPIYASKVTQIGAAAVWKAINSIGIKAEIKWPNDIVLNGKKICGILTEMSGELNKINYIVIGIGINVNIEEAEFPTEIAKTASSLKAEVGKYICRQELLIEILRELDYYYDDLINKGSIKEAIDICRRESVLLGKDIKIISKGQEVLAKAIDITDDGELIIEEGKERRKLISGEVSVRGVYGYV